MLLLLHYRGRTWVAPIPGFLHSASAHNFLHLCTGAVMTDLTVEQYCLVYPDWYGSVLNWPRGECPVSFTPSSKEKKEPHLKYAYHHSCLVSNYTISLLLNHLHTSAHHSTRTHSPFKTMLVKIRDKYQAYCTTYKTHNMATHLGDTGCPLDRGINLNVKDPEPTDIDNESTHSLDATVALGGPEAEGNPKDPVYSNHDKLMALTREINNLCQGVEAGEGQPADILDCIECKLQNLSIALHPPSPPTPTEPFWDMIHQYTNTLWSTQKQTNLTNSLLQDIAVFNEYNSTKLKEWLTDIETAADLTNKSQAKLAKAKLRGLTCTLVTEAINAGISWDEIKDLRWLKLCKADIHTYPLCFMEIQQWEKESLAAYIHQFKTEAKRHNFTNDAATIRIFIKGLKNAHNLATHIYEKGPQTLTDAISKVEKLNAIQQLTAMIIAPSTVNVMFHEEDCCFQCQEQGYIAWNCPHIRCYESDKYGHIVMDYPHRIPSSGTPANHHQPKPPRRCHTRPISQHHHEDRDRWSQSRLQSLFCRHQSMSHYDSYKGCSRSQHWDNCSHHRSSSWHLMLHL